MRHLPFPLNPKYEIYEDGTVIGPRKKVKPYIHKTGYWYISIYPKTMKLHRVLALTFIPNPLNLPQVNHIDGNKLNYSLSNLEWVNGTDNQRHAFRLGLKTHFGDNNPRVKIPSSHIPIIREAFLAGHNNTRIAKYYRVSHRTISAIRVGKNWRDAR